MSKVKKKKFFCCNGANKGIPHVAKMFSWQICDSVIITLLDVNDASGDNHNNAVANDNYLIKIESLHPDGNLPKEVTYGLSSGASGGGAKEGLSK